MSVHGFRGLVILFMALDHTRDFLQDMSVDPLNPVTTTVPLYLSRSGHALLRPIFVFLAGASAYLMGASARNEVR